MELERAREPDQPRTGIDDFIARFREAHGTDLGRLDETFLAKSLESRRAPLEAPAACTERLLGDPAEAKGFIASLRVTYSEFFRDPLTFALLERRILPDLAEENARAGRGEIRVWSAGCAGGQEAWSMAILLDELTGEGVGHRIFATDLSAVELAQACAGLYGQEAVGNLRLRHLDRCFCRQGDSYSVHPRLRGRVEFSVHDLLDESTTSPPSSIYGNFDVIVCSNVLIYYRPDAQRLILDKLWRCLEPGGCLVTSETERRIVEGAGGFNAMLPRLPLFRRLRGRS